ncbi:MAG: dephospho-CoA kinase [Clostridia bacterium]|nr:dephospho-CoA kinase [Clostridia bacterium]
MSIIIGLTGPTGSGKGSVSKTAEALGFKVIDCDTVARKATEKGSDGLKALTTAFGEDILFEDGTLNRRLLANKAFSSKEKTQLLNDTIFPFIIRLIKAEIKDGDYILDAPTLFESGLDSICDRTVGVLADSEIRLKRIIERDKLTINDAKVRMNAGKSDEFYLKNADFIIYNNADEQVFKQELSVLLKNIQEEK